MLTASSVSARPPRVLIGKVVGIADGDTFTLLVNRKQHRIRLQGIDCPEARQAFGTKAKKALAGLIFGKTVEVKWTSKDQYDRILGHVYISKLWINKQMIEDGFAWHFVRYSNDRQLAGAEVSARKAKLGLWVDPKPIAPWEFRRRGRRRNR